MQGVTLNWTISLGWSFTESVNTTFPWPSDQPTYTPQRAMEQYKTVMEECSLAPDAFQNWVMLMRRLATCREIEDVFCQHGLIEADGTSLATADDSYWD